MRRSLVDVAFPPHHYKCQRQVCLSFWCEEIRSGFALSLSYSTHFTLYKHCQWAGRKLSVLEDYQVLQQHQWDYLVFISLPVTVFSEVVQSDTTEHASQSVPTVSTSTPSLVVPGAAGTGEEREDVFLEPDTDRWDSLPSVSLFFGGGWIKWKKFQKSILGYLFSSLMFLQMILRLQDYIICSDSMYFTCWYVSTRPSAEVSVDPVVSQGDMEEPSQPSDKANLPSTSQEPSSSSAGRVSPHDWPASCSKCLSLSYNSSFMYLKFSWWWCFFFFLF